MILPSRATAGAVSGARLFGTALHTPLNHRAHGAHELREFEWDHELRCGPGAERLESVQVLERHGLLVDAVGRLENRLESLTEALSPENGSRAIALGAQDGRLLVAF